MTKALSSVKNGRWSQLKQWPIYWYVIAAILAVYTILYTSHLAYGYIPSRVAISLFGTDLVYWYGVVIVTGIILGSQIAADLGYERGRKKFEQLVPAEIRELPFGKFKVPAEISRALQKKNLNTLGDILFERGLDPQRLGLSLTQLATLDRQLAQIPGVEPKWLEEPAWRPWNPEHATSGVIVVVLFGIIGARIYHILTPSPSMAAQGIYSAWDYLQQPAKMFNLREGGIGIYGAIIAGPLGLLLYSWWNKFNPLIWSDFGAVGLALGQAIGRWGNFFNQELYGSPSTAPWALYLSNPEAAGFPAGTRFHPAFLYESLWSLLSFSILYTLAKRNPSFLRLGDLTALYMIFYSIGRILLELVRLDSRMSNLLGVSLPVATVVAIVSIAVMIGWRVIARFLPTN